VAVPMEPAGRFKNAHTPPQESASAISAPPCSRPRTAQRSGAHSSRPRTISELASRSSTPSSTARGIVSRICSDVGSLLIVPFGTTASVPGNPIGPFRSGRTGAMAGTLAPLICSFGMRRGSQSLVPRVRGTRGILVGVLAASMTHPAFALASHTSSKAVPSCSALSRIAIANLVTTGPLMLKQKIGNLCVFMGRTPGHYEPALSLQIVPWSKNLFSVAEHEAEESASREHAQFGVAAKALKVGKRAFFVSGTRSAKTPRPYPRWSWSCCWSRSSRAF